jgi:hypothetical protein
MKRGQEMKKEVLSFRKEIAPNSVENLKEMIKDNGAIEEVRIRFYAGQERSLQVRPYVTHNGGITEDMFTYVGGTENILSGDDDYFVFPVNVEVKYDEHVNVWVSNISADYTYTLAVDIVIAYNISEGLY